MNARDPTTRFSDRVADYARYRPRYPEGVLRVLREDPGLEPSWDVADVGSGTGLSAELFLANGNRVFAVEPNAEMRRAAEALNRGNERFISVDGTAEATGLAPGSIDLVVAAQAFHWFDPARAREHFRTILRHPHHVVLLWNTRRTRERGFLADYEALLQRFGTDYAAVRHDRVGGEAIAGFFGGSCTRRELPHEQWLDWEGLRGRLLSSSYTPGPEHPQRPPMLEHLRALFDEYQVGGRVQLEYATEIYSGTLA